MKVYESIFSPEIRDFLSMRQKSVSRSAYEHDIQTLELFDRYLAVLAILIKPLMNIWLWDG